MISVTWSETPKNGSPTGIQNRTNRAEKTAKESIQKVHAMATMGKNAVRLMLKSFVAALGTGPKTMPPVSIDVHTSPRTTLGIISASDVPLRSKKWKN